MREKNEGTRSTIPATHRPAQSWAGEVCGTSGRLSFAYRAVRRGCAVGRRASRPRLQARPHRTPPIPLLYRAANIGPAGPRSPLSGSRARIIHTDCFSFIFSVDFCSRTPVTALSKTATATAFDFLINLGRGGLSRPPRPPATSVTLDPFTLSGRLYRAGCESLAPLRASHPVPVHALRSL